MTKVIQEIAQAALRSDLYAFCFRSMQEVMPGGSVQNNWHMLAICTALEKMINGETERLVINTHPRIGKSLLSSVGLPMYLLMLNPAFQIMCLSYSETLSADFHQKCRLISQAKWYRDLNPALKFKNAGNASLLRSNADVLQTSKGGYRLASSMGGSFTGKGADVIIIDDPNDMGTINSQSHRDRVNSIFDTAIASRLNNKNGRILVVSQRGHIDDLSGHLLAKGSFKHLKIEAIATHDQTFDIGKGQTHFRKKGDLVHPERFGQKELDERMIDLGSAAFEAQYQQNPQPPGGVTFKREWIHLVDDLPEFQYIAITADIAQTLAGGDYTAFVVWGYNDGVWYVLHAHRVQYDMPGVLRYYQQLDEKYEPDLTVIESNGPGSGVAAMLRERGLRHIDKTTVKDSKPVRALNVTNLMESKKVVFSSQMENRDPFLNELLSFPNGKHDDWVDAFTLGLLRRAEILCFANQHRRQKRKHLPQAPRRIARVTVRSTIIRQ